MSAEPVDSEPPNTGRIVGSVEEGFTPACELLGHAAFVKYVAPDAAVDYVELRSERRDSTSWTVETRASAGVSCATAVDPAGCADRVAKVRMLPDSCSWQSCDGHYYIATRGDGLVVAMDPSDIRALMGRVDHPAEAFAAATFLGRYPAVCVDEVPPQFRALGGGYELVLAAHECTDQAEQLTFRVKVRVDADGSVHELSRIEVARKRLQGVCVPLPTQP
jgi:hypothetical protein